MTGTIPAAADAPTLESARKHVAKLAGSGELPLPDAFRRACEAAVENLRVERAGIWLFVNNDQVLRCVNLFERTARKHTKGACLTIGECPAFCRAVASASLIPCESARTDPRTAELAGTYFAPLGITSTLDAPLVRDGKLVGVLFCEHVGSPRGWSESDRAFALALAEFLVNRMKAAEGALKSAIPPRTQFVVVPPPVPTPVRFANELKDLLAEIEVLARSASKNGISERFRRIADAAARSNAIIRKLFDAQTEETAQHETIREDIGDDDTGEHPVLPVDAKSKT